MWLKAGTKLAPGAEKSTLVLTSDWLSMWRRDIFPPNTSAFVHVLVSAMY